MARCASVDGEAGGMLDGLSKRSEEGPGTLEEEADDEDEAEDEDDKIEEGRRASIDVLGTCTRMAQSRMKPE